VVAMDINQPQSSARNTSTPLTSTDESTHPVVTTREKPVRTSNQCAFHGTSSGARTIYDVATTLLTETLPHPALQYCPYAGTSGYFQRCCRSGSPQIGSHRAELRRDPLGSCRYSTGDMEAGSEIRFCVNLLKMEVSLMEAGTDEADLMVWYS
jgi:hypothetical protein